MKYEKEFNTIVKEIKKQFNDVENLYHYMPPLHEQPYDRRDPSYDDEKCLRDFYNALREGQENLLDDERGFEEFVLENNLIRNLIIIFAKKVCKECING